MNLQCTVPLTSRAYLAEYLWRSDDPKIRKVEEERPSGIVQVRWWYPRSSDKKVTLYSKGDKVAGVSNVQFIIVVGIFSCSFTMHRASIESKLSNG
jgi:hypothetical protein